MHSIINCHAVRHRAAGTVDIQLDILIRVLGLQIQELSHDQAGEKLVQPVKVSFDGLNGYGFSIGKRFAFYGNGVFTSFGSLSFAHNITIIK